MGGAEIWRVAETGYLSGTPKKASKSNYVDDAPLPDPIRMGLPEFNNAPPKTHRSWRPQGPQEEDTREVHFLRSRIKTLAKSGLTIVEVIAICIMQGVQPLQYRGKPMWHFNGEDDATHCGCKGPDSATALARILSDLYKGEEEEFFRIKPQNGFSMYNPPSWVSRHSFPPFYSFWRSSSKSLTSILLSRN